MLHRLFPDIDTTQNKTNYLFFIFSKTECEMSAFNFKTGSYTLNYAHIYLRHQFYRHAICNLFVVLYIINRTRIKLTCILHSGGFRSGPNPMYEGLHIIVLGNLFRVRTFLNKLDCFSAMGIREMWRGIGDGASSIRRLQNHRVSNANCD